MYIYIQYTYIYIYTWYIHHKKIVHEKTHVQEEEAEDRVVRFDRVLDAVDGREGPGGDQHDGVPGQSPHELLHARLLLRRRSDGRSFSVVDARRKPTVK